VRGWVANNPILINGDTKILEAIAAGQCDVGLANTYYLARILAKDPRFPVAPFWTNQQTTGTHVNISGAGLTAHAKWGQGVEASERAGRGARLRRRPRRGRAG
jgi:iron(III) transport system substrate-binding protein